MKARVAAWALDAGAAIVNDVWGLQRDPDMARVVAEHGVPVIVMHNRDAADPAIDIMADIDAFFARSLEIADRAGIARDRIVLDPGIGFGKTPEQSITAIAGFAELQDASACRCWSARRASASSHRSCPSEPDQRLGGSIAGHLLAVQNGAAIVRAHDVAETVQALRVAAAIRERAMSDTIFVTGLALHAHHGVMEHEGKVGQSFMLDHRRSTSISTTASRSDRLADTVSYDQVVDVASEAFCAQTLPAGRGRRRRGRRRGAGEVSARAVACEVTSTSRTRRSPPPSPMSA